eukprot:gene3391-1745_t
MGCCSSNVIQPESIGGKNGVPRDSSLGNKEVEIIQNNWQVVEQDLQGNGLLLFRRLFKEHPDVRTKFYFAVENNLELDAIMEDDRLARHAKGVMDTISFAVSSLHDLPSLVPILKHLGAAHAKFQLQEEHFQAVGGALIWTLENAIGGAFDESSKNAWLTLFGVVAENMKKGAAEI